MTITSAKRTLGACAVLLVGAVHQDGKPAGGTEPSWTPDGRILFTFGQYPAGREIYVMNADGSGVTRLTDNTVGDEYPMMSPDGATILFSTDREGAMRFYVMKAAGGVATSLGIVTSTEKNHNPSRASWSPDGKSIAYPTVTDIGSGPMFVGRVDKGAPPVQFPPGDYPRISPDGRRVAFEMGRDLHVANIDGSNVVALTKSPDRTESYASASWVGARIVFIKSVQNVSEIWSMAADGSDQKQITTSGGRKFYAMASPDGKRVVYAAQAPDVVNRYAIYTVNIDGSDNKRVTPH